MHCGNAAYHWQRATHFGVVARLVVLEYSGSAAVPHASLAQGDGCHMGEVTGKEGSDLRAAMR